MSNEKKLLIFLVIVMFSVMGLVIWWSPLFEKHPQKTIGESKGSVGVSSISTQFVANADLSAVKDDSKFSDRDRSDIIGAHKDDVIIENGNNQDYVFYNENVLQQLIDAGDVRAMKVLYLRYLDEAQKATNPDKIIELAQRKRGLITKSIVYGDRELLAFIPEKHEAESRITSPNTTPEQKHQAAIDVLAYSEFMGLRGSLGDKFDEQKAFFAVYSQFGAPKILTDSDKAAIRTKAQEIYDSYEQERIKLGLGSFDNSVPEGMKKAFEKQKQSYLDSMGKNAI